MPADHISNTDYHNYLECTPEMEYGFYVDYEALKIQKLRLQHRCALYKAGLHNALEWLRENTNIHPSIKDSHLAENMVWDRLKLKDESGLE